MTSTASFLQNLAQRDAHRLAQKVSLLAMASLVLIGQWSSALSGVTAPDALIVTIIVGVLAYVVANRAAQSLAGAQRCTEDELMMMFVIDELL